MTGDEEIIEQSPTIPEWPDWAWDLTVVEREINEARHNLLAGKYVAAYQNILNGLRRYKEAEKKGVNKK